MSLHAVFTRQSEEDLYLVTRFIAESSPDSAARLTTNFLRSVERLVHHPRIGRVAETPASSADELRWLPIDGFPNHLIFYRVAQDQLIVVRIIHGARELESILLDPPI
jgi:toxin ParE1/3/4